MRSMVRLLAVALAAVLLFAACAASPTSDVSTLVPVISGNEAPAAGAEIALIITASQQDSPYMQALWSEISRFSGEAGVACGTYKTEEDDIDAALATLELAITGGARLVVAAGDAMGGMVRQGQALHRDLYFVLMDSAETFTPFDNSAVVTYATEQAGWLAGYAAVMDGARKLAFVNAETEDARRAALGFLLGAEAAAKENDIAGGSIVVLPVEPAALGPVHVDASEAAKSAEAAVSGPVDAASSEAQSDASLPEQLPLQQIPLEDFANGAYTVLFANDAAQQQELLRLARGSGVKMIGLWSELAGDLTNSSTLITYTQKGLGTLLYDLLTSWKKDAFPGTGLPAGVAQGGVSLVIERSNFKQFSQLRYEMALDEFSDGALANRLRTRADRLDEDSLEPGALGLERVGFYAPPPDTGSAPPAAAASQQEAVADGGAPPQEEPPVESLPLSEPASEGV